jgi:hypothetical protein
MGKTLAWERWKEPKPECRVGRSKGENKKSTVDRQGKKGFWRRFQQAGSGKRERGGKEARGEDGGGIEKL